MAELRLATIYGNGMVLQQRQSTDFTVLPQARPLFLLSLNVFLRIDMNLQTLRCSTAFYFRR